MPLPSVLPSTFHSSKPSQCKPWLFPIRSAQHVDQCPAQHDTLIQGQRES